MKGKSHSVAIWLNDTPAIDFVMPADNKKLVKLLENLRFAPIKVHYCDTEPSDLLFLPTEKTAMASPHMRDQQN